MNRVLKAVAVAIFSVCVVSWQLQAGVVNITQGSTSGYTMTDGNTYVIQNSVSFSNSTAGGCGMSVADNATVVLYIPAGVTLTARGANGSGQIGGGAGIRVPQTASLIITGEGTINVTGGNAGNGGNGANGLEGSLSTTYDDNHKPKAMGSSGVGGTGGDGGGGAGTGIGGSGGRGGDGGSGGMARVVSSFTSGTSFCGNGNVGSNGVSGGSGTDMGACYALGMMKVIANCGNSGASGAAGSIAGQISKRGNKYNANMEIIGAEWYVAAGGGGGGGGGAGSSPTNAIGGGGSAGGGGGGGGSGALSDMEWVEGDAHGGGGSGGDSSTTVGASGVARGWAHGWPWDGTKDSYAKYYGGNGGSGGAAGADGGAGTLYVSPTATVNVNRTKLSATTHSAAQYTITFDVNEGQFSSVVKSLTATLGCELPDCIPTPTRGGFIFEGWRTAANEEYYGASGRKSKSSYTITGNVVLYAQWRLDEKYVIPGNTFWIRDNAETGWFVDSEVAEGEVFRSGEIGNSTNSWMEATIVGPLSISFDWKVSCNTRGHYLAWLIDGVEQARIRGELDWTTVTAIIPEGEHIVRFDYVKGSTAAAGEDKGQVRNFAMGLRVDTDTMQVLWDWTTNYWVECSIVGKGSTTFEAQWVADGTNLVIPFSVNTPFYSLSLSGDSEGALLGEGSITVPITAPRSIVLNVAEYTYENALNSGRLSWSSGGAASWIPLGEVSYDGQDSVKSGEVTGDDVSTLSTSVNGPGTLSWWWRLDMTDCAGVDVFVDDAFKASLDYASDWTSAFVDIVGDGEHVVRFEFWNAGTAATMSDCAYLDQVSWTPEGGGADHTTTTPEEVPYSYFDNDYPTLLAEYGGDYEAAANATAANGLNKVWECFVSGTDPTNEMSRFKAKIEMVDGMPIVTWDPNLNTNGVIRTYKVYGKETLDGGGEWQYPTNSLHRFFKVEVGLP